MGILFGSLFAFPTNAYAECVNYVQSQAIAAAYEGDAVPTVHTIDTCGGDDTSYQIPIATTITFDGVQYSNVYATTNSVITFGNPDNTYWTYPSTPSISLYSMDWVSGWYNAPDTLNISYSEGGFQIDLQVIPFGQWSTPEASNINIIVAITNTGGISVAYSYQGPEYPNLRTGVRLHNGDIVSLEAWGATQIQPGNVIPTLPAEPVSEPIVNPTPTPTPTPATPEQQQAQAVEALTIANDINNINNLISAINGDQTEQPTVTPEPTPTTEPETTIENPDVIVEPEIITPDDPRFPDEETQTQPQEPSPSPSSDTTNEETVTEEPSPEPSEEPVSQPEDTNPIQEPEQDQVDILEPVTPPQDNNNTIGGLSEEELKKVNKVISANDAKLLAVLVGTNETIKQAVEEFATRSEENKNATMPYTVADATVEVQAEKLLEAVSVENITEILSNPAEAVGAVIGQSLEVISNPSEWGKDMTDDQREKAQEVIIPVILVSNIVSSVMSLRRL